MSNRAISFQPDGNGYRIAIKMASAPYKPNHDYASNTLFLDLDDIENAKKLIIELKSLLDSLERDVLEKEVTAKVTRELTPLLQQANQETTEKEVEKEFV